MVLESFRLKLITYDHYSCRCCFCVLHKTHKNAKHMEEINAANNIEALLKDHKNVTITTSYSHLAEGSDYTTTRQVRKDKKGNYFSYFKKEGNRCRL